MLKVTDDKHVRPGAARCYVHGRYMRLMAYLLLCILSQCLKFNSRSSVILNRFEQLTVNLTSRMQDRHFSSAIPPRTEGSSGAVPVASSSKSAADSAKDAAATATTAAAAVSGAMASGSASAKDEAGTAAKTPSKKKGKGGKKGKK